MNNEAELAAVLGHEVGHVAARYSARRAETAQRNNILGVLGQVLAGAVLGDTGLGQLGQQIASTAPQLATLSFSRTQELEADGLGIQYLTGAGYDPHAMGTVLASLAAQNSLDALADGQCHERARMGLDPPRSGEPGTNARFSARAPRPAAPTATCS